MKYLTDQIIENESGEFTSLGTPRRRVGASCSRAASTSTPPSSRLAIVGRGRGPEATPGLDLSPGGLTASRRLDRDDRQPVRRGEGDPVRSELPEGGARPRDDGPPAGVGVQAVRPRRRVPGGHPADADVLELLTLVLAALGRRGSLRLERRRQRGRPRRPLYTATEDSINVVFAQLIFDVTPEVVANIAGRMVGMDPRTEGFPPVASLATGSVAISPVDMAAGYQTIANDGRHCEPYTVQSIERDGKVWFEHERACDPVLKRGDARLITSMLEAVPVSGTAASAFGGWGSWPVAGKTGTAQENTNVWFGGYTKQFTTVVWVGSPGNPYSMGSVFGGTVAAPIWVSFMSRVMQGLPAIGFPDPPKPPEGPVPSVIGMKRAEAITTLSEAGFRASIADRGFRRPEGPGVQSVAGRRHRDRARHDRVRSRSRPASRRRSRCRGWWTCAATRRRRFLQSLGLVVELVRVETGRPEQGRLRDRPGSTQPVAGGPGQHRDDLRGRGTQRERERQRWWQWRRWWWRLASARSAGRRTFSCTTFPSTRPFAFPITKPITAPNSFSEVAPVAANASSSRASSSSSVIGSGAYDAIASRSARSLSASSWRPAPSNASIDSARFFTSFAATSRTSSSESSWRSSFSWFVTAADSIRSAPRRIFSPARRASVISAASCAFRSGRSLHSPRASRGRDDRRARHRMRALRDLHRTVPIPGPPASARHPTGGGRAAPHRAPPLRPPFRSRRPEEDPIPRRPPHPDVTVVTGDFLAEPEAIDTAVTSVRPVRGRLGSWFVLGSNDYFVPKPLELPGLLPEGAEGASGPPGTRAGADRGAGRGRVGGPHEFPADGVARRARGGAARPRRCPHPLHDLRERPRSNEDGFGFAVMHSPDSAPETAALGYGLIVAGHTHGGQVRLPWIGALVTNCSMPSRLASGLIRMGSAVLHTSGGSGRASTPRSGSGAGRKRPIWTSASNVARTEARTAPDPHGCARRTTR